MTAPGYFVVSPSMFAYAEEYGMATAAQCRSFVAAMDRAPGWRIVQPRWCDNLRTRRWPLTHTVLPGNARSKRRDRQYTNGPTIIPRSSAPIYPPLAAARGRPSCAVHARDHK